MKKNMTAEEFAKFLEIGPEYGKITFGKILEKNPEFVKKKMTILEWTEILINDPEFIKGSEREEQKRLKIIADLEVESSAIARDSSRFGYQIKVTWDLMRVKNLDPAMVSIMVKYLYEPNHSDKFREGIIRSLDVPESAPHFKEILDLFTKEQNPHLRWTIALALSAAAKEQEDFDIIERLIFDKKIGDVRSGFLGAIKRMKGQQRERTLAFAREDPELKINLHTYRLGTSGARKHKGVGGTE